MKYITAYLSYKQSGNYRICILVAQFFTYIDHYTVFCRIEYRDFFQNNFSQHQSQAMQVEVSELQYKMQCVAGQIQVCVEALRVDWTHTHFLHKLIRG